MVRRTWSEAVIVIPAYNPDENLIALLKELGRQEILTRDIIIVNDGSDKSSDRIFRKIIEDFGAASIPSQTDLGSKLIYQGEKQNSRNNIYILHNAVNLGKGATLKHAFNFFLNVYPESVGVVTCDADGQHLAKDIKKVVLALEYPPQHTYDDATSSVNREKPDNNADQEGDLLILGVRDFKHNVPFRSKIGNTITGYLITLLLGREISDTQTGLRGISRNLLPECIKEKYNGYEYEMSMLVKHSRKIRQIPIETVYIEQNRSSHFNPLTDSILIYLVLLKFCGSSLISAALDYLVFSIIFSLSSSVFFSLLAARIISLSFNFLTNKHFVFNSDQGSKVQFLKYVFLAASIFVIDYFAIEILKNFGITPYISKLLVEMLCFSLSYYVQNRYIFK